MNWRHAELLRVNAGASGLREHSEALFLTSSFTFENAAQAAAYFAEAGSDYVYSRFSNPTVKTMCERFARMEGAEFALPAASGMAAIAAVLLAFCKAGSRVVCGLNVFGATVQLLEGHLARFGVETVFVEEAGPDAWRRAAARGADVFLVESPSNPMQEVVDLAGLAEVAREAGALLAVDNCFCAGCQHPLALGADLVIHSTTKYPDGQGRTLGGCVAGTEALLMGRLYPFLRVAGPAMSPFNAWVVGKSLETLPARMRAHSATALEVAAWLEGQPEVRRVWHTALPSHPAHGLAMRQQRGMGGGLVTLKVRGGRAAAWRFVDALRLFSITANFGDAKSIVTHPASTTHARVSEARRRRMGLDDEVVRLSIGLEAAADLIEDLGRGLAAVGGV